MRNSRADRGVVRMVDPAQRRWSSGQLRASSGFVSDVIVQDELSRYGWQVQHFTFRLSWSLGR